MTTTPVWPAECEWRWPLRPVDDEPQPAEDICRITGSPTATCPPARGHSPPWLRVRYQWPRQRHSPASRGRRWLDPVDARCPPRLQRRGQNGSGTISPTAAIATRRDVPTVDVRLVKSDAVDLCQPFHHDGRLTSTPWRPALATAADNGGMVDSRRRRRGDDHERHRPRQRRLSPAPNNSGSATRGRVAATTTTE